jgi:hypothetical protein
MLYKVEGKDSGKQMDLDKYCSTLKNGAGDFLVLFRYKYCGVSVLLLNKK